MPNLPSGPGQTTADKSLSVVFASDAPPFTVSLEVDEALLATGAKQDTSNAALGSIDAHVDGLEASASSIDTKLSSLSAQATAAKQDTGNTSIASVDTKIGAATTGDAQASATVGNLFARLLAWNGATFDRVRSGVTAVSSVLTGFANILPWALYHLAPVTRTEGQGGPLETDATGNLRTTDQFAPQYENNIDFTASSHDRPVSTTSYNATPADIIASAAAGVLKASPGNLYRAYFSHSNAAAQVFALVNKATTPANGDTAIMYFYVGIKETKLIEFKYGKRFAAGIAWAQVTTFGAATITLAAAESVANAEVA